MNKRIVVIIAVIVVVATMLPMDLLAQCPMCRATAETNLANGGTAGRGLNAGILYMLAMPYALVGAIGYWWWRNRKKEAIEPPFSEN
ncbi:MAG: hypothetical protein IPL65_18765 [Lewinellaceae bacterium]|nr:hypothetical protein [Lewinellaceae bacterium]